MFFLFTVLSLSVSLLKSGSINLLGSTIIPSSIIFDELMLLTLTRINGQWRTTALIFHVLSQRLSKLVYLDPDPIIVHNVVMYEHSHKV